MMFAPFSSAAFRKAGLYAGIYRFQAQLALVALYGNNYDNNSAGLTQHERLRGTCRAISADGCVGKGILLEDGAHALSVSHDVCRGDCLTGIRADFGTRCGDPCVALHLERLRRGDHGATVVMTEK
jgi:hypothetical protein